MRRALGVARIVRRLKPSAESFAAAAAVYVPDLMLELEATRQRADADLEGARRCLAR
ncbi:MAG: hypothetical protein ACJ768_09100 [Gaiellaceae bacterium]